MLEKKFVLFQYIKNVKQLKQNLIVKEDNVVIMKEKVIILKKLIVILLEKKTLQRNILYSM